MLFIFVVVVVFSQISVLVESQAPKAKPVPTWSKQETGRFVRTYSLTLGQEKDEFYFMVDTVNQRAYTKITSFTSGAVLGEHWLIWLPPGALSGSDASRGFVYFLMQDPNPSDDKFEAFCSYKTGNKIHFGSGLYYPPVAFPDHWDRQDIVKIQPWIEIPSDINYGGIIFDNGVEYDVWNSPDLCYISDIGTLPCNKITVIKNTNVPATVFLASEASGQFRNSWWHDDEFVSYQETVGTINPPQNWLTTCFNLRNGFTLNPFGHAFVATPSSRDTFTLSLSAAPVDQLGPVVVYFAFDGKSCIDCVAFENENGDPIEIEFTSLNWQQPVTVKLRYLKEGESYFFIVGSGGGYEIPHYESYWTDTGAKTISHGERVLTCAGGVAGYGCDPE